MGRKPKFRRGQVVSTMGSDKFKSFLPPYWKIASVRWDKTEQFVYLCSEYDARGPWVSQKMLRALTAHEIGQRRRSRLNPCSCASEAGNERL